MVDADDKAKQLAAARKRAAAQAQELKKKKGGKGKAGASAKKGETAEKSPTTAESEAAAEEKPAAATTEEEAPAVAAEESKPEPEEAKDELSPISPTLGSTPQLAQQSKARSASFRKPSISGPLSPGLFSPDGETAPDIYRKHVARIEELEKENKRLAKEAAGSEKRWQKAEDELSALREGDADTSGGKRSGSSGEVEKMKNDLLALQRQNSQLQSQLSRSGGGTRHGSSPSISMATPATELEAQLQSKSATIETMELEMSRLRAQVERLSVSASTPSEQLTALEEKLARAEKAAALAQRELADLKRNLERTSEKAVREGSERASAETKLRTLEREVADLRAERDSTASKADALEKKVATLTTVHKDQDGRTQTLRKEKERSDREVAELKSKLERAEAENLRLRKKDAADGGGDDDAVDELVDEGRRRLEDRVRELEAENTDLRRGIWHERRKEMQTGPDDIGGGHPGARFTDVDLGGPGAHRRGVSHHHGGGGFGDFFASGLNALTGANAPPGATVAAAAGEDDEFLDDDSDFDEEAFRKAHEEEAKKRLERIKEVKRSLKNWEGWRLDLVESRRGGGEGIGEIFEI